MVRGADRVRTVAKTAGAAPPESLLVPLGALLSVLLPYVVFSLQSDETFREAKLAGQALGGAMIFAGIGLGAGGPMSWPGGRGTDRSPSSSARAAALLAGLVGALLVASSVANFGRIDPLTAVAILAPAPLLLVGIGPGRRDEDHLPLAERILDVLCIAGVATGALAFSQRFLGVLRMPLQTPEPRFLAAALVGNPGDVGAALVLPGLVLWTRLADPARNRRGRVAAAAGLAGILAGLGATESLTAFLAFCAGVAVHALFDLRRRVRPIALLLAVGVAVTAASGLGTRIAEVRARIASGDLGAATTQRDIGILSAVEAVRARPLLGAGPGAYGNVFVPSRLAAEERIRRPLFHRSTSAHFENAHDEALTLAVECGLPALVAALAFGGILVAAVVRARSRRSDGSTVPGGAVDASVLAALLAGGVVLAAGNFPLRLAVTSGPIAFVLGLAVRTGFVRAAAPSRPAPGSVSGRAARAALGLAMCALLVAGAAARFTAAWLQGEAEALVRGLVLVQEDGRAATLAEAAARFESSLRLRPRSATALLGLGSVRRLSGDEDGALDLYVRSFRLCERAETDLNLGRALLARGDAAVAGTYFLRAAWILPRLAVVVPPDAVPGGVEAALERARKTLAAEGKVPALAPLPTRGR